MSRKESQRPGILASSERTALYTALFRTYLGNAKGDSVLVAQLLQLRQHGVADARDALGVQAVHHALHQVDLRNRTEGVVVRARQE